MTRDVLTVAWKEWKEVLLVRGNLRGGVIASILLPLFILGIFLPWQFGAEWVRTPATQLVWIWMPLFMVSTLICDSFAGERERHTLETLLASRLSDRAILFGKITASVAYGWGLVLAGFVLGLVTVNVLHGRGGLLLFPASAVIAMAALTLLAAALAASAGVLISLRAKTVRQAQQTLGLSLMALIFGISFGIPALPDEWKRRLVAVLQGGTLVTIEIAAALVLAAVDAALIAAGMARFQRARLSLD